MATLFMLMGLPGSGKSTLARRLEAEREALVLTPDDWMTRIVRDGYDADRREAVKAVQLDLAARVLELVVLEFGFFSRKERDATRARAAAVGAATHLVFLDLPFDLLWQRLDNRNRSLPPNTFRVTQEQLRLCEGWLQRPQPDEPLWRPE